MFFTRKPIDWQKLQGHIFETGTGARFSVIQVTAKTLTIRPEAGTRNYAISIDNELERVLDEYAAGKFLPAPSELVKNGVRPVQSSYVWGILRALYLAQPATAKALQVRVEDFVGRWRITELSEPDEEYFEDSDEPLFIEMKARYGKYVTGSYQFGLSNGSVEGELREFGGEAVLLFAYAGTDEMDEVNGAGWLQLRDREHLIGELVSTYGRLTAEREPREFKKRRSLPHKKQK